MTTYSAEKARGERTSFQRSYRRLVGKRVEGYPLNCLPHHNTSVAKCTPHSQPRATNFTIHSLNDKLFDSFRLLGAYPKEIETLGSADHTLLLWCHNSTWNTTACHKFHLHPYDTGVTYRKLNHCRGEIMFRSTTAPSDDHPIMPGKPEVVRALA